ncbi:MAG: ribonuclease HII [Rhodobacteraceae bacterium]|nr:ribonuclease HII [Paracoccaceae bacterium]
MTPVTSRQRLPDDYYEREARQLGATRIAGVDEVGRGPLAGPVSAAAVVLDFDRLPEGLRDSKQLSHKRREALAEAIHATADLCIVHIGVEEIEQLNILGAAHLAMRQALAGLAQPADFALIDGKLAPRGLNLPHRMVVKGDAKVLSIAAASIVAKVARDAIMAELARTNPGYGWDTNAGYPTPAHRAALARLGVTPHHRRSFAPVHKILYK